jgi:uncharacterized membrane protein
MRRLEGTPRSCESWSYCAIARELCERSGAVVGAVGRERPGGVAGAVVGAVVEAVAAGGMAARLVEAAAASASA